MVFIYLYRGCFSSEIDKGATCTQFCISSSDGCHGYGTDEEAGNAGLGQGKAFLYLMFESLATDDVEEASFDVCGVYSYGVNLQPAGIYFVFLWYDL